MRSLEEKTLYNIQPRTNIWVCYVEDIFVTWEFGQRALLDFLTKVNKNDNNIIFIIELGNSATSPFHGVLLIKYNNILVYGSVKYTGNTLIQITLHNLALPSLHVFNSFINRTYHVRLEKNIQEELNNIIFITKDHSFSLNHINVGFKSIY